MVPASAVSGHKDFSIKDGVLMHYNGSGGDVIVPDNISEIRDFAFQGTNDLISVTVPATVTKIGKYAFSLCPNLASVTILGNVGTISEFMFVESTNLKSVSIGGATKIEHGAFLNCSSLTEVTLPAGLVEIGEMAFCGCSSLSSITLPESVEYVGERTFGSCESLTNIAIPENTVLHEKAFLGSNSIQIRTTQQSAKSASKRMIMCGFENQESSSIRVTAFFVDDNGELSTSTGTGQGNTMLYDLFSYGNEQVVDGGYSNRQLSQIDTTPLTSFEIPSNVVSIGRIGSDSLECVTIPSSVHTIKEHAFMMCKNLKKVIFPSEYEVHTSLKRLNYGNVFFNCPQLEELVNCPNSSIEERMLANRLSTSNRNVEQSDIEQSEQIITLSNQICHGINNNYDKVKAIFDWVRTNVEYDYDYYFGKKSTVSIEPKDVLKSKLAVCDGYARLTSALVEAQGIPSLYLVGRGGGSSSVSDDNLWEYHAWNAACVDGCWIYLDTTWGKQKAGDDDHAGHRSAWFDPTELYFSLTHKWEDVNDSDENYADQMMTVAEIIPPTVEVEVGPFLLGHDGNAIQSVEMTDEGLPLITVQTGSVLTVRQNPAWVGGVEYLYFWDNENVLFNQILNEDITSTPAMDYISLNFDGASDEYDLAADIAEFMDGDFAMYTYHMIFRLVGSASAPSPSAEAGPITAVPNRSTVQVDGQTIAFDAYTINQNNYFKLRDLAMVLNGTGRQFEVTWDGKNNAINLISDKSYTVVGGELAPGDGTEKTAVLNTSTIYLNGQSIQLTAYTINNNNYFKLRDVGQAFDFNVSWDGVRNTIVVNTSESYTAD